MSKKVLTPHHHFIKAETDFICRVYPLTPTKIIAKHMGLSTDQVMTAANRKDVFKITSQDIVNFNGILGKTCGKCRVMKDLDKFRVDNYHKSGLATNCKKCKQ